MAHRELRRRVLPLVLLATVVLAATDTETVQRLRPVRQVKVSRSERSSVYEKSWKTVILSAAIPKSTITCFILQCALPTRHIALSTKLLSLTRLMICFLRRTKMSSLYSMARISRSEHHTAAKSRLTWWNKISVNRMGTHMWLVSACCPDRALVCGSSPRTRPI